MKKIFTLLFAVGTFTLTQAQPGTRDNRDSRQPDQRSQQTEQRYQQQQPVVQQPAQRDYRTGGQDWGYNNSGSNSRFDDRISPDRQRDMEIARINREYDFKVERVSNSFFMRRWEKQRQIRTLEAQRQQEIKMVYLKFASMRDRHDDRGSHYNSRF